MFPLIISLIYDPILMKLFPPTPIVIIPVEVSWRCYMVTDVSGASALLDGIRRKMLRYLCSTAAKYKCFLSHGFIHQRGMHSRNKKAMELVAKGWNALKEVDRVIDYTEPTDPRLHPHFRTAKENFELALETDNSNTHARYWLARLHIRYKCPGACPAIGAALLVEAANMGDSDAQYELGCHLRFEVDFYILFQNGGAPVESDQKAFYYLQKAVDQLHPGALYLLGAVYLAGDCVKKDIALAICCFHKASKKGHTGAAIAYGSLLLKGAKVPEDLTKLNNSKKRFGAKLSKQNFEISEDPIDLASEQFQVAAEAGCDLGLRWLKILEYEEKLSSIG
ncbi:hypothetical protein GIB67_001119 [Kingdonia uniflora]|uniref:Binding protein n=1 Tax=Kingdonia uniflora TaxID=39325 RepID=A0A7J7MH47_9MAGN|nr:hypothetical protein GIB67_001119 [Kingdonia uniflora]